MISNFAFLSVVFKLYQGSESAKPRIITRDCVLHQSVLHEVSVACLLASLLVYAGQTVWRSQRSVSCS